MPGNDDSGGDEKSGNEGETHLEHMRLRLQRLERLVDPEMRVLLDVGTELARPAWKRVTRGEPRLPVSVAIIVAIALQVAIPSRFVLGPRWLLPLLAGALLVGIVAANPRRIDRTSFRLRTATMALIATISFANAWAGGRLIQRLLNATEGQQPTALLATGAAIWATNVLVFALWYWELDRGGPGARALAVKEFPDFLFVQMQSPELAPPQWEPTFGDYLYVSFTNATAFSPTDVLPLSRWAKMTMMLQSAVSLTTVALVVARAVNILK